MLIYSAAYQAAFKMLYRVVSDEASGTLENSFFGCSDLNIVNIINDWMNRYAFSFSRFWKTIAMCYSYAYQGRTAVQVHLYFDQHNSLLWVAIFAVWQLIDTHLYIVLFIFSDYT